MGQIDTRPYHQAVAVAYAKLGPSSTAGVKTDWQKQPMFWSYDITPIEQVK